MTPARKAAVRCLIIGIAWMCAAAVLFIGTLTRPTAYDGLWFITVVAALLAVFTLWRAVHVLGRTSTGRTTA